jgi:hypothetical protein
MQVFIVRPFGTKKVTKNSVELDYNFETVHQDLIAPALNALNLEGGTTGKIFEPGDIREDMFSLLLLADIVIADITIHNANVFYELGIRHALRDRKTILIKSPGFHDTPFDILGYKYVEYEREEPAKALDLLIETITATMETNRQDSPVFKMLPKLESQNPERFLAVPPDFTEEVNVACKTRQAGRLSLLAFEAETFPWKVLALRLVGEALFTIKAFDLARLVWERIKQLDNNDLNANDRLATIYQRLAEKEIVQNPSEGAALLVKSDLAIDHLLSDYADLGKNERAEAYALKARNTKTKWINTWKNLPADQKGITALQSGYLEVAFKNYEHGFYENLNHFYAGINALSLLTIMIALADAHPQKWNLKFKKQKEADQELEELKEKKQSLAVAVQMSIDSAQRTPEKPGEDRTWLNITEADFAFLTETRPDRVSSMYTSALEGANTFHFEAARRQLEIFEQLQILPENVNAALNVIPDTRQVEKKVTHYLLFTGHMIDKPDRQEPRFPAAKETQVKKKIQEIVENEKKKNNVEFRGIAGGACGGDIIFHETCKELGINSALYLALPRDKFITESVQFAGVDWVDRFNKLYQTLERHQLCDTEQLPKWLDKKKNYSIWERNNLWELNNALQNGGMHMTLIALWDGKGGDGAGGTEHMVKEAQKKGAKTIVIDMKQFV